MRVEVKGLDLLEKLPARLLREAPYVAALGLTRLASESKRAIDGAMRSGFDRPTQWTMRAIATERATKASLQSRVGLQDDSLGKGGNWTDVLSQQFRGGDRRWKRMEAALRYAGALPSGLAAIPSRGWRTDPYGNMRAARVTEILSYLDAQRGGIGNMRAAGRARYRRRQSLSYFVARSVDSKTRHLHPGIYAASDEGAMGSSSIAPALLFTRAPRYRRRIDLHGITHRVVATKWDRLFLDALAQVVR
jgi:hypothetical protein